MENDFHGYDDDDDDDIWTGQKVYAFIFLGEENAILVFFFRGGGGGGGGRFFCFCWCYLFCFVLFLFIYLFYLPTYSFVCRRLCQRLKKHHSYFLSVFCYIYVNFW